jgi:hypothetical protein
MLPLSFTSHLSERLILLQIEKHQAEVRRFFSPAPAFGNADLTRLEGLLLPRSLSPPTGRDARPVEGSGGVRGQHLFQIIDTPIAREHRTIPFSCSSPHSMAGWARAMPQPLHVRSRRCLRGARPVPSRHQQTRTGKSETVTRCGQRLAQGVAHTKPYV